MRVFREPLFHFIALGVVLFLLFGLVGDKRQGGDHRIVVTEADLERLVEGWSRIWQRPPMTEELEGLIEEHIKEEILYREAVALGLDVDDTIVRRRLRQKMEFVAEALAGQVGPTEDELLAYLAENPSSFRIPGRISFEQIFFSRDRRGDRLEVDARDLLGRIRREDSIDPHAFGDTIPIPATFDREPERSIENLFGGSFLRELNQAEENRWWGPVESEYGLHLVLVKERVNESDPSLDAVREAVRREWLVAKRKETDAAFYEKLRERYTITVRRPEAERPGSTPIAGAVE